MNDPTPIAVFVYNRPHHARQLLDSLLECARLDECQIFVFCDGPKKPEHRQDVLAARRVAYEFSKKMKTSQLIERSENLGLARSIVSGVTDLCEKCGRVIVLEDDFILHPFFINFMLQALDRYSDDERVAQVAGFTFPIQAPPELDAFFLPLSTSWGWATWQRAWQLFSWDVDAALQILDTDPQKRDRFDLDGAYPYSDMLRRASQGKVDSWAIRWYWQTFAADKLTLYPRQSLVWQNGFDEGATNTSTKATAPQISLDVFSQAEWPGLLSFPKAVQVDPMAFGNLKRLLRRESARPFAKRVKDLWKRVLH